MPALTFDDFDKLTARAGEPAPAARPSSRALTFDDFDKLTAPKQELDAQGRVGGLITSGLLNTATGLAGLPADVLRYGQAALDYSQSIGQKRPYAEIAAENAKSAPISPETLDAYGGAGLKQKLLDRLPAALDVKPENAVERAIETGASFLGAGLPTGALRSLGALGAQVGLPAAATVGTGAVAGMAGLSPTATAIAEGAAGVLGGGLGAVLHGRHAPPEAILRDKVRGMDPADLERAQALMDDAAARGVRLLPDEAYAQVTGQNANPLTGARSFVERTPEGQAVYAPLMAERPEQIDRAGRGMLRDISPTLREPGQIGGDIQIAARSALNDSPEGRQMLEAARAAGPRISPMQAGDIIQPELRSVYDRRMQARADADAINYPAAEAAPERVGVDRYLTGERPGEPIVTEPRYSRPQFTDEAPKPLDDAKATAAAATPAGPESLARYIARNGGIRLDGDAAATDLHRFNIPGLGPVARPTGKGIDNFWREELIDKGYLPPDADGGAARDISSTLLRKLQNEQRGFPSYPVGAERAPAGPSASKMNDEFANAVDLSKARMRDDLTGGGIDPDALHPDVQSRIMGSLVRGEHQDGLDAYEAVTKGMRDPPTPYVKSTTVEEPVYAPRFGQAYPQAALDYIDQQLARGTKGDIADHLEKARDLLMERGGGQVDMSVAGLGEARKAINALMKDKPNDVKSRLMEVRNRLDADLSVAPEYEVARSTHEQLSRPLDPFDPSRPAGKAVEQDPLNSRFLLPPEKVPDQFLAPSAAREFRGVATPSAQTAQARYVTTHILDGARDGRGEINSDALLRSIRDNHDTLTAFPDVRQRLINVATARDGLARAEQSTILGRVSQDPDVKTALKNLFDPNALPETHAEITRSVRSLAARNPQATAELLRLQAESMLNTAQHTLMSGDNLKAGAKWSVVLRGHPQQRANLEAFMRGLPNGEERLRGFSRMMEIMEATGKAPAPQSNTAFFSQQMKDASQSGLASKAALAVKTGGTSLLRQFNDFAERAALGKNTAQIANILTQPNSGRLLAQLARTPTKASRAQMLAYRLTYMGRTGATQQQD